MSGYIGTQPVPQATQTRDSFTATSGQTSFATGGYTPNFLDVYLNGVKLASADYTATNGSDVVLASGASTGDILEVVAFTTFTPADLPDGTPSIDDNGNATAMTIDSSENVMLGNTVANPASGFSTQAGFGFTGSTGKVEIATTANAAAMEIGKNNANDGDLLTFRKQSTTVGSIGVAQSGDRTYFSGGSYGIASDTSDTTIMPCGTTGVGNDGVLNLGKSDARFKDAYLSGGVYLGGTGSANKLDDYEYGTWTPVYVGSSSSGSYTYVENQGHYIKIGNQVTCWFNLTNITTSSTGSGVSQINGLPFTANFMSGFNAEGVGTVTCHGWTGIDGDQCWPLVTDGQSYVRVYKMTGTNNSPSPVEPSHKVDNNSDLRGFLTYTVSG